MSVNIYTSLIDNSSIKVLFVKEKAIGLTIFDDIIKQIQNLITHYSSNIDRLNSKPKYDYIDQNRSLCETKPFKINTVYRTICSYNENTNLTGPFTNIDHVVIFVTHEKKISSINQSCDAVTENLDQPLIYRVIVSIDDEMDKDLKLEYEDQNGTLFNSINELAENVVLNVFCKFNSIIVKYIDKGYDKITKIELSEDNILDVIYKRTQIARIYLTLRLPISSAMYYNSIVELIENHDFDVDYYLAHCFEGQAALLYNFYYNSDNSFEWWEVVSNSLNSFIHTLPLPIQVCLQSINYSLTNHADSVNSIQSRKQILFDIILKKLTISLNLLYKTNNLTNGITSSDSNIKFNCNELTVPIYELIIKKSQFLLENFVRHFYLDRKIVIEFLDPFVYMNLPSNYTRNDLFNFAMFLMGCAQIYLKIKSKRRVGIILIKLSQLLNENKLYNHSYYISCAAYQWYSSMYYGIDYSDQAEIIRNLAAQILKEDDNYSSHTQCVLCNVSNNPNILIGNSYTFNERTEKKLGTIFEKYCAPSKQFLDNNYQQYLTIYKHDLSLSYSAFISNENLNLYQDLGYTNAHYELLASLKPFINSFVCYGVHSMLQAYRKLYLNKVDLQRNRAHPSRYEMLALIIMIESSILFGCASRSATVLLLILDKIVYFPPIHDYDTLKIIQSKCIDSLSIISNTIQLPIIRAPFYSVTNNKNRGYTSIESLDHLFNNLLHTTHLILIFDISFEQTRINANGCKCTNELNLSNIFNSKVNVYCSNCESRVLKIDNSPWLFCKSSKINYFFDSKFIFQSEFKWVPIKENKNIKLPILSYSKVNQSNLFLYNPFEKKVNNDLKEIFIHSKSQLEAQTNILWQAGKQYTIYVSLFNPFLIPIILDCFSIIIEGEVECDISPVSVVIPPSPKFSTPGEVKVAIVVIPKNSGNFSIIGVTYKFSGINYVNFGSKIAFVNNRNYLRQYLNVFVIPSISNSDAVFWEKIDKQNLFNINDGRLIIRSKKKLDFENEKKIKLISAYIYIDQMENILDEDFLLEDIVLNDNESIITILCRNVYKVNRLKLLITHWMEFNGKVIVSSKLSEVFSNIPQFPSIKNINLVPKLNFQPIDLDLANNKWKVSKVWMIITLENNSRLYPVEFSFFSNLFEDKKLLLMPDKKIYRWVVKMTVKNLIELQRSSSLLCWKAFFPNNLLDNKELELFTTGSLAENLFMPDFLSKYEFHIEIRYNGVSIGNKQAIPVNSVVSFEIHAIAEKGVSKANIKIIPFGDTLKLKQIYLDYTENDVNSEMTILYFSIIGLEKKKYEWIVGVEELETSTQKSIIHWKDDLLSISFT